MSKVKVNKYKIKCNTDGWIALPGLIIYVEREYNPDVNESIIVNLEELNQQAEMMGYRFVYLPDFLSSCGAELYKYMTGKDLLQSEELLKHHSLAPILGMDIINQLQGPSLLFTGVTADNECEVYQLQLMERTCRLGRNRKETRLTIDCKSISAIFEDYIATNQIFTINSCVNEDDKEEDKIKEENIFLSADKDSFINSMNTYAACSYDFSCLRKDKSKDNKLASPFGNITLTEEENMVLEKVQMLIERLQDEGIPLEAIMAFFTPEQKLSSIKITETYQIILPEYNDMEIPLPAVQKAVYFLFLKHPEGINFKYMPDYREELFSIYRKLAQRGTTDKLAATVDDLVNPLSNALNEKCSRIKNMFRYYLTENLAKHYYITGEKGECKRIGIDTDNILWMKEV